MSFGTAKQISETLQAGEEVNRIRGENRVLVNNMLNGEPYVSEAEARKWKLDITPNWGEAPVLAAHARRQYDNAFLGSQNFFKVQIPLAPEEKKSGWGSFITNKINRTMKKCEPYNCLMEYVFASVVSQGIGPRIWRDSDDWLPDYVALEDFRVPTDTKTSFKELGWFAERHLFTPGELSRKVFGKNSDPRWKKDAIKKILHEYDDQNFAPGDGNYITSPERRAEAWKQSAGYFANDKMPSIALWTFFYYEESDPKNCYWKMCVIPDWGENAPKGCREPEILYDSGKKPFAKKIEHILNVQFGDLNTKSPFNFYSVRSLGFLLMEPCFWSNMVLCRQVQYLMESFNPWFRVEDPADRARVQKIDLAGQSVLEKGVSIVPNTERHQVDPRLIEMVASKTKQLQAEASQTYTQSTDTGTAREQTAFETRVKLSAVNAMMTGLLGRAFRKETHAHREICRRFCLKNTSNADAKEFQQACLREGIPRVWLDVEHWEIEPEMPMGAGNPTMAMTAVQELMGIYPMLSPTAQSEVIHEAIEVYTNDPRKADRWQPIGKEPMLSTGKKFAGAMFGSLMVGVPAPIDENLPPADLIEVWLGMASGVISMIEKRDNIGTAPELAGLSNVAQHIDQQIQRLAQVQSAKSKVKEYSEALGELMNIVKGFAQRLAEKNASQNGDPEAAAKVAAIRAAAEAKIQTGVATTRAKLQSKQASDSQKLRHKEESHVQKLSHQDQDAMATQTREHIVTGMQEGREDVKTAAEIARDKALVESQIKLEKKKAAEIKKTSTAE